MKNTTTMTVLATAIALSFGAAALADSRSPAPVSGRLSTVRSTVRLSIAAVASPKPGVYTSLHNGQCATGSP